MQKFKANGQSVSEWKLETNGQTDRRTDGTADRRTDEGYCITCRINTVDNKMPVKELYIIGKFSVSRTKLIVTDTLYNVS